MGANTNLNFGVGNISMGINLGMFYQDLTPGIYHFENNSIGNFDENDIPYLYDNNSKYYSIIYVIQYALILHDLILKEGKDLKPQLLHCINWLECQSEDFKDSIVWRNDYNKQYNLEKGWISAMYQGQAISLFLRAYQMFGENNYLNIATKAFEFFKYDYAQGGTKRIDNQENVWFEEYPTPTPSYVLNGFIYTMLGILDYYRVVGDNRANQLFENCVKTLEQNLHKYDVWYWSVYDQLKKQLVSYYYQKNVHIPLMEIMFLLTKKEIFNTYAIKWTRNLKNPMHRIIVEIMYRVRPRIIKLLPS